MAQVKHTFKWYCSLKESLIVGLRVMQTTYTSQELLTIGLNQINWRKQHTEHWRKKSFFRCRRKLVTRYSLHAHMFLLPRTAACLSFPLHVFQTTTYISGSTSSTEIG